MYVSPTAPLSLRETRGSARAKATARESSVLQRTVPSAHGHIGDKRVSSSFTHRKKCPSAASEEGLALQSAQAKAHERAGRVWKAGGQKVEGGREGQVKFLSPAGITAPSAMASCSQGQTQEDLLPSHSRTGLSAFALHKRKITFSYAHAGLCRASISRSQSRASS